MLQESNLTHFMGLPELQLTDFVRGRQGQERCFARKKSSFEICPKCATPSSVIYDHRKIKVHDAPVRGSDVWLEIIKRRFYCKKCKKPFTEPVQGIRKGKRTTERFRRNLLWACENFSDLKRVKKAYRCSNWLVYQTLYEHLKLNVKRHINENAEALINKLSRLKIPAYSNINIRAEFLEIQRRVLIPECLIEFYESHPDLDELISSKLKSVQTSYRKSIE